MEENISAGNSFKKNLKSKLKQRCDRLTAAPFSLNGRKSGLYIMFVFLILVIVHLGVSIQIQNANNIHLGHAYTVTSEPFTSNSKEELTAEPKIDEETLKSIICFPQ